MSENTNEPKKKQKTKQLSFNLFSDVSVGLPLVSSYSSKNGFEYIPYSSSCVGYYLNNTYPQTIAKMKKESPTNGAALNAKILMMKGEGFDFESMSPQFAKLMKGSGRESLNSCLKKICQDYAVYNGFALKVCWNNKGLIYKFEHVPFGRVRVGKPDINGDVKHFVVSDNWDNTMTYKPETVKCYPVFNPEHFKDGIETESVLDESTGVYLDMPNPSEVQKEQAEQLIYFWNYEEETNSASMVYPTPSYSGALNAISTEIAILTSDKNKVSNGLNGNTLVFLPMEAEPLDEDEKVEEVLNFKNNFTGPENSGAVNMQYVADPNQVNIHQLETLNADVYNNLSEKTISYIVTAHNIPRILMELASNSGFSSKAEELNAAVNKYQKTVIKDCQNDICEVIKTLAFWMGYEDENINIIPYSLEEATQNVDSSTALDDNNIN